LQSGEKITRVEDLQDIDELHVVEVQSHFCSSCPDHPTLLTLDDFKLPMLQHLKLKCQAFASRQLHHPKQVEWTRTEEQPMRMLATSQAQRPPHQLQRARMLMASMLLSN
jgi:hypothetical protein